MNSIEEKGEENTDVVENQRKNFLEYLFGYLVKDVATEQVIVPFKSKKKVVEKQQLFEQSIVLPSSVEKIIDLDIRKPFLFSEESFIMDTKSQMLILALEIKSISHFVQMINFDSEDAGSPLNQAIEAEGRRFLASLERK